MEVVVPAPPVDFNFDSACSSPYMTAPSSPQRFGNFFFSSAPTSPSRASAFYYDFYDFASGYGDGRTSSASEIPFLWEEMSGVSKSGGDGCSSSVAADEDFEFDFSGQLERTSLSAEELFDCGKIRALDPPPSHRVADSVSSNATSPRSSKIAQGKRMVQEAFSPRDHRRRDTDPFEEAIKTATTTTTGGGSNTERNRGRERTTSSTTASRSSSSIRRTGSRSLSPLRVSDIVLDSDLENPEKKSGESSSTSNGQKQSVSASASFLSAFSLSRGQKRWRIRDLLLFRSASEGRAADKKVAVEEMKNSSFRSIESTSSVSSSSRRRGAISAHEMHYKTNRAVSEELRKKTSLPYKHGLLGCLGFNSTLHRNFSRGFGSLART